MRLKHKIMIKNIVKCYLHGIALPFFTVLLIFFIFIWLPSKINTLMILRYLFDTFISLFPFYEVYGQSVMLVIILVAFILSIAPLIGFTNNIISSFLWFPVETNVKSTLGQGILLIFLMLLNVYFIDSGDNLVPNIYLFAKCIFVFTILPFVNGFMFRGLAARFMYYVVR